MAEAIDAVELAHLVDIRAWRKTVEEQLAAYRERVTTYEAELHDSAVMERGHLAFLHRKYGAESVNPDGTLIGVPAPAPPAIEELAAAIVGEVAPEAAPAPDAPPVDLAPNMPDVAAEPIAQDPLPDPKDPGESAIGSEPG